jgi:Ser/Thr protein kinase RdoA (MazF antagonist)
MTCWHPGQTLESLIGKDRSPATWPWFERTGALLADLHNAASGWTPPQAASPATASMQMASSAKARSGAASRMCPA